MAWTGVLAVEAYERLGLSALKHNPLLPFLSVCDLDLTLLLRDTAGQEAIETHR